MEKRDFWILRWAETWLLDSEQEAKDLFEDLNGKEIIHVIEYAAYEELERKLAKAIEALEKINEVELNSQRPGGGRSESAKVSFEALAEIKGTM